MAAAAPEWFYVDATSGQPVGPYDLRTLQGLISGGYIKDTTHLWKEGQPEWLPLQEVHELRPLLQVAREVQKAVKKNAPEEDELAAFQAEISALEAAAASEGGDGEGDADGAGRADTPEELEFVDDDGTEYVWDTATRKYVPKDGGASAAAQQPYDEELMTFAGEEEVQPSLEAVRAAEAARERQLAAEEEAAAGAGGGAGTKRKAEQVPGSSGAAAAGGGAAGQQQQQQGKKGKKGKGGGQQQGQQQQQQQAPGQWFELKNNTSIYVTGLPDDVMVEEVASVFSRFGLIKEDEQRQPRIKLYRDKHTGMLKGDALVSFLREPSVALAVNIMDGAQFRPGKGPAMSVQPAKFEQKGDAYMPKSKGPGGGGNKKAKKALIEKQERLLGWGGFDDKLPAEKVTVILRNMFRPEELVSEQGSAAAATELEQEVAAEVAKLGPVKKVRVFKDHPEGVVSVRFKTEEAAKACIERMQGRFFGGRTLAAAMWDGITNYAIKVKESAEEEAARLEAYARELEARNAASAAAAAAAAGGSAPGASDVHTNSGAAVQGSAGDAGTQSAAHSVGNGASQPTTGSEHSDGRHNTMQDSEMEANGDG